MSLASVETAVLNTSTRDLWLQQEHAPQHKTGIVTWEEREFINRNYGTVPQNWLRLATGLSGWAIERIVQESREVARDLWDPETMGDMLPNLGVSYKAWRDEVKQLVDFENYGRALGVLKRISYLTSDSMDQQRDLTAAFRERGNALLRIYTLVNTAPEEIGRQLLGDSIYFTLKDRPVLRIMFDKSDDPGYFNMQDLDEPDRILKNAKLKMLIQKACEEHNWRGIITTNLHDIDSEQVAEPAYGPLTMSAITDKLTSKNKDKNPIFICDGYGRKAIHNWGFQFTFSFTNGTLFDLALIRASQKQTAYDMGHGSPWHSQIDSREKPYNSPWVGQANSRLAGYSSPWIGQIAQREAPYASPWVSELEGVTSLEQAQKNTLSAADFYAPFDETRFASFVYALEEIAAESAAGMRVCLQAVNRFGKTTMLRALLKVAPPDMLLTFPFPETQGMTLVDRKKRFRQALQLHPENRLLILDEAGLINIDPDSPESPAEETIKAAREQGVLIIPTYPRNARLPKGYRIIKL